MAARWSRATARAHWPTPQRFCDADHERVAYHVAPRESERGRGALSEPERGSVIPVRKAREGSLDVDLPRAWEDAHEPLTPTRGWFSSVQGNGSLGRNSC